MQFADRKPVYMSHIPPARVVRRVAERSNFTADVWQDLCYNFADEIPFVDTPQLLEVITFSASNVPPNGIGARRLELTLLDEQLDLQTQVVDLNGSTAVNVPGGPYLRMNNARVVDAGSNGGVDGGALSIQIQGSTGQPDEIWGRIKRDRCELLNAAYTVPNKCLASLNRFWMKRTGRDPKTFAVQAMMRMPGETAWNMFPETELDEIDNGILVVGSSHDMTATPGIDLRIRTNTTGVDPGRIICGFIIDEWDDETAILP